jgi:predicted transcriptional regulator
MVAIERALSKVRGELSQARMEHWALTDAQVQLAKLAVEQGMSQRAVAELLGVSHTAVQKMLRTASGLLGGRRAERIYADAERAELRKANRAKLKRDRQDSPLTGV